MPSLTVTQLAALCGGIVEGEETRVIRGANTLECATSTDLAFAAGKKAIAAAEKSQAGCLVVDASFNETGGWTLIRVNEPRRAFARVLTSLYPRKIHLPSVHPTSCVAASAKVPNTCTIGAHATLGEHVILGEHCYIGNGCSLGDNVQIGDSSTLHAGVLLYDGIKIGARVTLQSGCVIGADGFGFTLVDSQHEKFPQVGTVEIEDDVEIGANSCVDRAALGVTRIGKGTKLDNLVHVAHNCILGRHVVVAAQTGFSGSVTVGDYAVIGGQAGIGERARIESRAIVGGKAGVLTSQTIHSGEPVWGIPARPLRQHLKGLANVRKLTELREEVKELRRKVAEMEAARSTPHPD